MKWKEQFAAKQVPKTDMKKSNLKNLIFIKKIFAVLLCALLAFGCFSHISVSASEEAGNNISAVLSEENAENNEMTLISEENSGLEEATLISEEDSEDDDSEESWINSDNISEYYENLPEYTGGKTELNIYNWGQYISDGSDGYINVIEEFEKVYPDIKVNYMTFDSNESMYTKLQTDSSSFDIVIPSDYMIEKMIAEDMLAPLDFSNIPNYAKVDDSFKNMSYDPENIYSVPYTWGYVGLIYNSRYVNAEDVNGSWDLLWDSTYAGKILMFDNCRDAFAISELLLGYSLNSESEEELSSAAEKLRDQNTLVQSYVMDQVFDKMERGEAWVAPYYAGDYLLMVQENPDLEFVIPDEGYNLFVDGCCILKNAQHKTEAELFINFLCEPVISGQNLEYLGYSTPISAAKEYMDEEISQSEIAYPSDEVLARGQSFSALSNEGNQLMNELWLGVKTSNSMLLTYLIPTVCVFGILVIILVVVSVKKRRDKARRCKSV